MSQWINYHHLYYFKTIAEKGSISAAAEILRIGQPALSSQLKQLEDSLGVSLFERRNKRLFITDHGKVALNYCQNIFKLGSEMSEVLKDIKSFQRLQIHIGAQDNISKKFAVDLIKKSRQIGDAQISLSEGNVDFLCSELQSHRVDLVISNYLPQGSLIKGIEHKIISRTEIYVYGAKKFLSLKKSSPLNLSNQPLILPTYDSKLRYDVEHWFVRNSQILNLQIESQDIAVKKAAAAEGMGLLLCPKLTPNFDLELKELAEIGRLSGLKEEVFLLRAKRNLPNPLATQLFDLF